jgi:hypothetical protein
MEDEVYINIIRTRLADGQTKALIKLSPIFSSDPERFEKMFSKAYQSERVVRDKKKRNKLSKFGKTIGFRLSLEDYEKFEHLVLSDVTFTPRYVSHNYRTIFMIGLNSELNRLEEEQHEK